MDGSTDIVARSCLMANNTAGEDGGTIASLNGHGIIFRQSELVNSISGRHGGGVFASSLEMMDVSNTPMTFNEAVGRGGILSRTDVGQL